MYPLTYICLHVNDKDSASCDSWTGDKMNMPGTYCCMLALFSSKMTAVGHFQRQDTDLNNLWFDI